MPRTSDFKTAEMKFVYHSILLLDKMALEDRANHEHPNADVLVDWNEEYVCAQEAKAEFMEHIKSNRLGKTKNRRSIQT